jgi:DNA polymerase I
MSTFLIIDSSNLAYRAAYGNKELRTSKGVFSGHVFGAVSMLSAFLRELAANYNITDVVMCFCYDGKDAKNYRRSLLPEYKANRTPHDIDPLPGVVEILRLWPGLHIVQDDKEGDDAIAFAVKMRAGRSCIVWSGDKDLFALLKFPNCQIFSPNLKRFVETVDLQKHFHIKDPERVYLAKALFGDSSDNIEGVKRLIKKQVEPILNAEGVLTPTDFYGALGTQRPVFITENMWSKLLENVVRVGVNYSVILPQLDFSKSSVVKVGPGSLQLLKQKLVEYECFSLLGNIK